jgi:hypothetical protein
MNPPPRQDLRPGVSEPVVLMISRREVEQDDLASVLARLQVFLATREDAWLYPEAVKVVVAARVTQLSVGANNLCTPSVG